MKFLSLATELAGIAVFCAGLWMLAPWVGVTAGGLGLVLLGVLSDPRWAKGPER